MYQNNNDLKYEFTGLHAYIFFFVCKNYRELQELQRHKIRHPSMKFMDIPRVTVSLSKLQQT